MAHSQNMAHSIQEKTKQVIHQTKEGLDEIKGRTQHMVGTYADYAERSPLIKRYGYSVLALSAVPAFFFIAYAIIVILMTMAAATTGSVAIIGTFLGIGSLFLAPTLLSAAFLSLVGVGVYQSFNFGVDLLHRFYQWIYPKAESASESVRDTAHQAKEKVGHAANQAR